MDDLVFLDGELQQTPIRVSTPEHRTKIEIILRLYAVASKQLYLNNMEDFLILRDWLGLGIREEGFKNVPSFMISYEVMRLSQYLDVSEEQIFWTFMGINANARQKSSKASAAEI